MEEIVEKFKKMFAELFNSFDGTFEEKKKFAFSEVSKISPYDEYKNAWKEWRNNNGYRADMSEAPDGVRIWQRCLGAEGSVLRGLRLRKHNKKSVREVREVREHGDDKMVLSFIERYEKLAEYGYIPEDEICMILMQCSKTLPRQHRVNLESRGYKFEKNGHGWNIVKPVFTKKEIQETMFQFEAVVNTIEAEQKKIEAEQKKARELVEKLSRMGVKIQ